MSMMIDSPSEPLELLPSVLVEPILRRVHFNNVPTIEALVDWVYNEFRSDFYPGEWVIAQIDGKRYESLIREKIQYSSYVLPNGELCRSSFSRYRVERASGIGQEVCENIVDEYQLQRSKEILNRNILFLFFQNVLIRENFPGAPWRVRDPIANYFRIDTNVSVPLRTELVKPLIENTEAYDSLTDSASEIIIRNENFSDGYPPTDTEVKDDDARVKVERIRRFPCEDLLLISSHSEDISPPKSKIEASLGPNLTPRALEIWCFLLSFSSEILFQPCTFDDFCDAISDSEGFFIPDFLEEVHCAILICLINKRGGVDFQAEDWAIDSQEEPDSDNSEDELANTSITVWRQRLLKRQLANGGWENVILGIFYEISLVNNQSFFKTMVQKLCETKRFITEKSVARQYWALDFHAKINVLHILVTIALQSEKIRSCMETREKLIAEARREKMSAIKKRKKIQEDLRLLQKDVQASYMNDENGNQNEEYQNGHHEVENQEIAEDEKMDISSEEKVNNSAKLSSKYENGNNPDNPLDTEEVQRNIKVLDDQLNSIEEEIGAYFDETQKTKEFHRKCLGEDRYFNRYFWFDQENPDGYLNGRLWICVRNDLSTDILLTTIDNFLNDETSIIAIRNSIEQERQNFVSTSYAIDEPRNNNTGSNDSDETKNKSYDETKCNNLDVAQKNDNKVSDKVETLENGLQKPLSELSNGKLSDAVDTAQNIAKKSHENGEISTLWKFVDTEEQINMLLQWLDPRGVREHQLKAALENIQNGIERAFAAREKYLALGLPESKKISTRSHRMRKEKESRCWHNNLALSEKGQLLSHSRR